MSDTNPTGKELSAFGQCLIDKHYDRSYGKLTQPQPNETEAQKKAREATAATLLPEHFIKSPEAHKKHVLETIGIDGILDLPGGDELVAQCKSKLPNTKPIDLKKAARAQRS